MFLWVFLGGACAVFQGYVLHFFRGGRQCENAISRKWLCTLSDACPVSLSKCQMLQFFLFHKSLKFGQQIHIVAFSVGWFEETLEGSASMLEIFQRGSLGYPIPLCLPHWNDMYCTLNKLAIKLPFKRLSIKIKPNTTGIHIWLDSTLEMFGDFICDHRKITHSWQK
jgi:hypothetical protein